MSRRRLGWGCPVLHPSPLTPMTPVSVGDHFTLSSSFQDYHVFSLPLGVPMGGGGTGPYTFPVLTESPSCVLPVPTLAEVPGQNSRCKTDEVGSVSLGTSFRLPVVTRIDGEVWIHSRTKEGWRGVPFPSVDEPKEDLRGPRKLMGSREASQ